MPPKNVPTNRDLAALAPKVRIAAERVLAGMKADGFKCVQFDTLRTRDRQAFLFGKGRTPEQLIERGLSAYWSWPTCADGVVTRAAWHTESWHGYGLACDFVENDKDPWVASQAFWAALGRHAIANGLRRDITVGGHLDLPHTQLATTPKSPTIDDRLLLESGGIGAVWRKYKAD